MMIKKFVAPTMNEAMAQMKKELGPDAVILKSNKIEKGGLLDFAGKEMFELMAAVDKGTKVEVKDSPVPVQTPARAVETPAASNVREVKPSYKADVNKMQVTMLQSELSEIKDDIAQVGQFLKYINVPSLPENLQIIMKQLLDNDIEEPIARKLVESIQMDLQGEDYDDLKLIVAMLLKKIGKMVRVVSDKPVKAKRPRIVTLVGPTGVGKTTTIAKLATNQKLLNKKKVALISADTFRIGAVDQLKTFANIADIPLTVVYKPEDMATAIRKYKDYDVIYIDTTGRSQRDSERLMELSKYIENAKPDETHLVLSVTTRLRELTEAAERFRKTKYNRILLTKLDETTSLGTMLNLATVVKMPISYLTAGQNVPEDIERATVEKIARLVVRRKSN